MLQNTINHWLIDWLIDNNNTCLMTLCSWLPGWACTRKVKPIWIYWSRRRWVVVASTGPYANLHLTPDTPTPAPRQSVFTSRMPFCCSASSVKVHTLITINANLQSSSVMLCGQLSGNNFRQVVHTDVPLWPSSIIWYWSQGSDALWLWRLM